MDIDHLHIVLCLKESFSSLFKSNFFEISWHIKMFTFWLVSILNSFCIFTHIKKLNTSLSRELSRRIKKKMGGRSKEVIIQKGSQRVGCSITRKGIWVQSRSLESRRTGEGGDFAMINWDFTHYCGYWKANRDGFSGCQESGILCAITLVIWFLSLTNAAS